METTNPAIENEQTPVTAPTENEKASEANTNDPDKGIVKSAKTRAQLNPLRKSDQQNDAVVEVTVQKGGKPARQMFKRKNLGEILNTAIKINVKPIRLYGSLLWKGETLVVFSAPNQGKSLWVMDVAFRNAGGSSRNPGKDDCEETGPVEVIDCELSDTQFAHRYVSATDQLSNLPINRVSFTPSTGDVAKELGNYIKQRQADPNPPKLFIIDNVTALTGGCPSAAKVTQIMNELKALKVIYGLTLVIVAHTSKGKRNKPLTEDSLGGSRMLANFADAMVGIGCGKNENLKYIKLVKARSCNKPSTVDVMEISDTPYVGLNYICEAEESELLDGSFTLELNAPELEPQILKMYNEDGMSIDEIAANLSIPATAVASYIASL